VGHARAAVADHGEPAVAGRVPADRRVHRAAQRIRVSRALERIGQGERSLAGLAFELGFADHAHLTRTVRAVTGHTPTGCRALL